ncbi:MAG: DUF6449 domain-containing protein [Intestinibacillus sp.]
MTSKNSFFNASLLRETLRRNLWAVTLSVLGFFFTLPLPVAMTIQSTASRQFDTPLQKQEEMSRLVREMLGLSNPLVKFVIVVMAAVCAISIFSYLHSRQKTDFYHSLPVRRGTLFTVNYAAGAAIVLPCYFVMMLVACLIAVASGVPDAIAAAHLPVTIATHLVFFFAVYALAAVCTVLCGNTIVSLLLMGWATFSFSGAAALWSVLQMAFYRTYGGMGRATEILIERLSPVVQFFILRPAEYNGKTLWYYNGLENSGGIAGILALYLFAAAALTVLAYFLFKHRQSERAGGAIAFAGLKAPLKFWCCTVMAVGVGWMLYNMVGESKSWMFFGFVLGGVLTHFLMEIIYNFDFKAIFRHKKQLLVYAGVFAVLIACMHFDITGYDRYLPDAGEIAAVDVQYSGYKGDGSQGAWRPANGSTFADLTDPESIAAAVQMAQSGVAALDGEQDQLSQTRLEVHYHKKSGGEISRSYSIPYSEDNDRLFDKIRFSEEYRQKRAPAFTFELTGNDRVDIYTSAQPYTSWQGGVGTMDMNQDEVKAILEALRSDTLRFTPEQAKTEAPVLRLTFLNLMTEEQKSRVYAYNAGYDDGSGGVLRSTEEIAVYPSYTETLRAIERYTGVTPVRLTPDDVSSVALHLYSHQDDEAYSEKMQAMGKTVGEETVSVTDRLDIAVLLENAITDAERTSADLLLRLEPYVLGEKGFNVTVQLKNGATTQLYYPVGQAPDQIFAEYFPQ